jgi:hypothetical protein
MATFKAELPSGLPGLSLKNGVNVLLVEAVDATDAAALVAGHQLAQDDALWANATITAVGGGADLSPVVNPDSGQTNSYVFTLAVTGAHVGTYTHTAAAGEDLDAVMAAMVILLNLDGAITGAAWASPVLTLSDVGDNIGDAVVAPTVSYGGTTIVSFSGATVDGGIAGAALTQAYSLVNPSISHMSAS